FFFSSRRRHTRFSRDWSSDVCSSDLDWVSKGKEIYTIPLSKIEKHQHLLVLAYRNNEFESNGIPADIVEITDSAPTSELYLSKGDYTIVMKDRNYNIVEEYNIEIE